MRGGRGLSCVCPTVDFCPLDMAPFLRGQFRTVAVLNCPLVAQT
jgi:hypothetical protein